MNVLMFGWEFPPIHSGGLGTACYGLTKSLAKKGINITLVLPSTKGIKQDFLKLISANVRVKKIDSLLRPYLTLSTYNSVKEGDNFGNLPIYGSTLFDEVYRYTREAVNIGKREKFDVIHCHDWMTYGAGIRVKEATGKPLVVHVHATEFDRTGGHGVNQYVYDCEKQGMLVADLIFAVSNFTKNKIIHHYGINPDRIIVVHNSIDMDVNGGYSHAGINKFNKIVLFLGRITLQKGPDYFLYAAKKVLDYNPNVRFIIAGSGDMERFAIEKAAELGIADKVLFAGFLNGADVDRVYKMADLYVMPSVSEPFGLTPLEAIRNDVPVLISKQSGVSEVLNHCLKVDFWDVNEMANKILGVLNYRSLSESLKENASLELKKFSWDEPARKCIEVYKRVGGIV